jgi:predicted Holliday junction resolvase-like endonuclease
MSEIGAILSTIVFVILLIVVLFVVIVYSVRLQRRAVVTQDAVVDDHFAEKAQRQRHLALAEEALELQKRAVARDEETRDLLRRSVELNEQILSALRNPRP